MLIWMGSKSAGTRRRRRRSRQLHAARALTNDRLTGSAAPTTSASSLVPELPAAETRQRARPHTGRPQAQTRNRGTASPPPIPLPAHPPRQMTHEKR